MRVAGAYAWGRPRNSAAMLELLKRAFDLGHTFFDTADSYGPNVSEELIAEALHPYPKELVIATKGGLVRHSVVPSGGQPAPRPARRSGATYRGAACRDAGSGRARLAPRALASDASHRRH